MTESIQRADLAKAFLAEMNDRKVFNVNDPALAYHLALLLRPEGHPTIKVDGDARGISPEALHPSEAIKRDEEDNQCPMVGLSYPAIPCIFREGHPGAHSFTLGHHLKTPDGTFVKQGSEEDRATWWTCGTCGHTGPNVGTSAAKTLACMGSCGGVTTNPSVPRLPETPTASDAPTCRWSHSVGYDCELPEGHEGQHVDTDYDGKSKVGWKSEASFAYRREALQPKAKEKRPSEACSDCGMPMLPPGEVKRPNEYDHARGCPKAQRANNALRVGDPVRVINHPDAEWNGATGEIVKPQSDDSGLRRFGVRLDSSPPKKPNTSAAKGNVCWFSPDCLQRNTERRRAYIHDTSVLGPRSDCCCSWCENGRTLEPRTNEAQTCNVCSAPLVCENRTYHWHEVEAHEQLTNDPLLHVTTKCDAEFRPSTHRCKEEAIVYVHWTETKHFGFLCGKHLLKYVDKIDSVVSAAKGYESIRARWPNETFERFVVCPFDASEAKLDASGTCIEAGVTPPTEPEKHADSCIGGDSGPCNCGVEQRKKDRERNSDPDRKVVADWLRDNTAIVLEGKLTDQILTWIREARTPVDAEPIDEGALGTIAMECSMLIASEPDVNVMHIRDALDKARDLERNRLRKAWRLRESATSDREFAEKLRARLDTLSQQVLRCEVTEGPCESCKMVARVSRDILDTPRSWSVLEPQQAG